MSGQREVMASPNGQREVMASPKNIYQGKHSPPIEWTARVTSAKPADQLLLPIEWSNTAVDSTKQLITSPPNEWTA
ncbi:13107_t:CDS:2 [Funneliformis geosporum]|uniref:13107_t:CDS:1 n=1 Tax=Funneliformis geosporum TaxID=1117311 RepID=A0A9W4SX02_9GLOM|nr:13107_t:CDS:2 [Funneliformis geosporum]